MAAFVHDTQQLAKDFRWFFATVAADSRRSTAIAAVGRGDPTGLDVRTLIDALQNYIDHAGSVQIRRYAAALRERLGALFKGLPA